MPSSGVAEKCFLASPTFFFCFDFFLRSPVIMPQPVFKNHTSAPTDETLAAVFSPFVHPEPRTLFGLHGGKLATQPEMATWFVAAGINDREFIQQWYRADLRVVAQDLLIQMVSENGCVFEPNYALAAIQVDPNGLVVPASEVFDFEHKEFHSNHAILRELTPPSPFSPRPRHSINATVGEKRKRGRGIPPTRGSEVIDLTRDDEEAREVESMVISTSTKVGRGLSAGRAVRAKVEEDEGEGRRQDDSTDDVGDTNEFVLTLLEDVMDSEAQDVLKHECCESSHTSSLGFRTHKPESPEVGMGVAKRRTKSPKDGAEAERMAIQGNDHRPGALLNPSQI
ncbi:hypothetical protein DFH07DRAFT_784059 [Mycena maculata]|uniref:Uncharacterized protein n=1 Tax=Mycena maculata TaxID=230809 RepID=A0AAD7MKR8_9AGAR|nr:hypothetical protein DFH07DRAFT_784059 [Mycena maculata]